MGGICCGEAPEVKLGPEEMHKIGELVMQQDKYKALKAAVPVLIPTIAAKHPGADKAEESTEEFLEDERMLSSISDKLKEYGFSAKYAEGQLVEAVCPLAEQLLADDLKRGMSNDIPEWIKDKAVEAAIEKAVEKSVDNKIQKLVEKQIKGEPLDD